MYMGVRIKGHDQTYGVAMITGMSMCIGVSVHGSQSDLWCSHGHWHVNVHGCQDTWVMIRPMV